MTIEQVITELKRLANSGEIKLNPGASQAQVAEFEKIALVELPEECLQFYTFCNGFEFEEDIFSLLSLDAIIENTGNDKLLCVADYMISCDEWFLEVTPFEEGDYQIVNFDADGEKLVLTKSFADFISRFLNGRLFDKGGIYDLHEEVKYRLEAPVLPGKLTTLLTVFNEGLRRGLISKTEVVQWADQIILKEPEPDYFFIELSLCSNESELISIIHREPLRLSPIVIRVIYGLVYRQLLDDVITAGEAVGIVYEHIHDVKLLSYEISSVHIIEEEDSYCISTESILKQMLLDFLVHYKDFTLTNYMQWGLINKDVSNELYAKEIQPGRQQTLPTDNVSQEQKPSLKKVVWLTILASAIITVAALADAHLITVFVIIVGVYCNLTFKNNKSNG